MRRIPLLVLAVLLLGTSLVACSQPSRSSAASSSATVAPASSEKLRPTALFFGDSYFVGGGCSPDATRGMAALAGQQLGYRPEVRGAGGTGFVAANPEYGAPPYLAQVAAGALKAYDPQLVVIEGGSNDFGRKVTKISRNARTLLTTARSMYPDATLMLAGPMQTYGDFSESDPIKRALRKVAKGLGIPFINMQKWTYGHDDWLCSDYVHPTYDGHVILGQRLAEAITKRM